MAEQNGTCGDCVPMSRTNYLLASINNRIPKSKTDIRSKAEERQYDEFLREAEELYRDYGIWPVFEMGELEYDEIPDIYGKGGAE